MNNNMTESNNTTPREIDVVDKALKEIKELEGTLKKGEEILVCDNCLKPFILNINTLKNIIIKNIRVTYFACEHCGKAYISYVEDNKVRELQNKLNKKKEELNKIIRKFDRRQEELKDKISDDLKRYINANDLKDKEQ